MPWKTDENGMIVVQDEAPVWVYEDGDNKGKEAPVEFGKTLASIQKLTAESVSRKEKIKEMSGTISIITDAGIEDVEAFIKDGKKAMETVANLDDKQFLDAGEVEKIKAQANEIWERKVDSLKTSYESQIADIDAKLQAKDSSIRSLIVRGAFDRSSFLAERTVLPPEIAYSYLGDRFVVQEVNGELRGFGLDTDGNKLMSAKNPAEYADPEEAIELLVMSHPQKDRIMKMEATGTGSSTPGNTNQNDLLSQYKEAQKANNASKMISLKRKLHNSGYRGIL